MTTKEWNCSDLVQIISVRGMTKNMDIYLLIEEHVLHKEVCKRKVLSANNPDIQLMLRLIYENKNAIYLLQDMKDEMLIK